ncbi:hypothetical protein DRQ09_10010, partial [candidate division KSB1 bacterium]
DTSYYSEVPPTIQIKKFSVNRKDTKIKNSIKLKYFQNNVKFSFSGISFINEKEIKYKYILEGYDKKWSPFVKETNVAYNNLRNGKYTFKVLSYNKQGIPAKEPASVFFIILPPFWRTWWFISGASIIITGFLYLFYKLNLKAKIKQEKFIYEYDTSLKFKKEIIPEKDPSFRNVDIASIYLPSSRVGGNFYGYTWVNAKEKIMAIYIGDIEESGLHSIKDLVFLTTLLKVVAKSNGDSNEVLSKFNNILYRKDEKTINVNLSFSIFDITNRIISISNAGLGRPIMKRDDNVFLLNLPGPGLPIGVRKSLSYKNLKIELKKNDFILFFTNGLIKSRNKMNNEYGYERLEKIIQGYNIKKVTSKEIIEIISEDFNNFCSNVEQKEDVTLIALKLL